MGADAARRPAVLGELSLAQKMSEAQKRAWDSLEDLDEEALTRVRGALGDLRTIFSPLTDAGGPTARAARRVLKLLEPASPRRRLVDKALLNGNLPYMEWVVDTGVTRILASRLLFVRATAIELDPGGAAVPMLLFGDGLSSPMLARLRRRGARFAGVGLSIVEADGALLPYRKWLALTPEAAADVPVDDGPAGDPDRRLDAASADRLYVSPGPAPAADRLRPEHVIQLVRHTGEDASAPAAAAPGDLEPLTPGAAVLGLFAAAPRRRKLGIRAVDALIALCQGARCRRLVVDGDDPELAWRRLRSLAATAGDDGGAP